MAILDVHSTCYQIKGRAVVLYFLFLIRRKINTEKLSAIFLENWRKARIGYILLVLRNSFLKELILKGIVIKYK